MKVRLLAKTEGIKGSEYENKSIDEIIVGIARLSSSKEINELFKNPDKLIRHCLSNQHWSIFEMANLTIEVQTSRAIGREILRHSLHKQEFSARYAKVQDFEEVELREQSKNNRQSSVDVIDPTIPDTYGLFEAEPIAASQMVEQVLDIVQDTYENLLDNNIAKECARMILPETAQTTIILNGEIRLWISFLNQRLHKTAQKEIRLLAEEIKQIFMKECPIISEALFNFDNAENIPILDRVILEKYK